MVELKSNKNNRNINMKDIADLIARYGDINIIVSLARDIIADKDAAISFLIGFVRR